MKIVKTINKVPGGMMVIPLLLAVVINTVFPQALKIGSFTTAFFSNTAVNTLVGFLMFQVGTHLKFNDVPEAIKRGGVLLGARILAGVLVVLVVGKLFGPAGFLGVSLLALISTIVTANGNLYLSLMSMYGDDLDFGAQGVMVLHDGPFLSLCILGITGVAYIPFISLLAAVVPLIIGFILGNLDEDISKMFHGGTKMLIPFIGFSIGAGINLQNVVKSGFGGLVLGLTVFVLAGFFSIVADRLVNRRPGYAGAALSSIAGNTLANPTAIAEIIPAYKPFVEAATTQIAAGVILTIILVPPFTAFIAKKYGCAKFGPGGKELSQQFSEKVEAKV